MTFALVAVALLALGQTVTVLAFVRYIAARDEAEAKDRQVWANRVQSPATAVAQTLVPDDFEPVHIPFDNEEAYFKAYGRS